MKTLALKSISLNRLSFKTIVLATIVCILGFLSGYVLSQEMKPTLKNLLNNASPYSNDVRLLGYKFPVVNNHSVRFENQNGRDMDSHSIQDINLGDVFSLEARAGKMDRFKVLGIRVLDDSNKLQEQNFNSAVYIMEQYENIGILMVKGQRSYLILVEKLLPALII